MLQNACFSTEEGTLSEEDWLEEFEEFTHSFQPSAYKLLVVDDDEDQLGVFALLLEQAGFGVVTARSAEQAIGIMRSQQIDLIVSDLRMPTLDGTDFIRFLRGLKPFRAACRTPVIIMSCCDNSIELDLLKLGADMFCNKESAKRLLVPQIKFLLR